VSLKAAFLLAAAGTMLAALALLTMTRAAREA